MGLVCAAGSVPEADAKGEVTLCSLLVTKWLPRLSTLESMGWYEDVLEAIMAGESPEVLLALIRDRQLDVVEDLKEIKRDVKGILAVTADLTGRVNMVEKAEAHHGKRLDEIAGPGGKCEKEQGELGELRRDMVAEKTKLALIITGITLAASALFAWLFKKL